MAERKFPKPERGVERYEVYVWIETPGLRGWFAEFSHSRKRPCVRFFGSCSSGDPHPAYIYDRRTGEVIATNEKELKR